MKLAIERECPNPYPFMFCGNDRAIRPAISKFRFPVCVAKSGQESQNRLRGFFKSSKRTAAPAAHPPPLPRTPPSHPPMPGQTERRPLTADKHLTAKTAGLPECYRPQNNDPADTPDRVGCAASIVIFEEFPYNLLYIHFPYIFLS
jgi:hypothetical protein